jgi:hypothetical protein
MAPALSIQDLISEVLADAPDAEPLTRLATAASMMRDVGDNVDATLGYFVDQARRAGHSWSEIGEALGVSKQAAQQRHGPRLGAIPVTFERFTARARAVLEASEMAARDLGHGFIGTEHLLLAQYSEPEGVGAQVLSEGGLEADDVRTAIVDRIGRGPGAGDARPPYTPRAIEALKGALTVALELGHNYIGTEHLLLGVAAIDGGVANHILSGAGLDETSLREKVLAKLTDVQTSKKATRPRKRKG